MGLHVVCIPFVAMATGFDRVFRAQPAAAAAPLPGPLAPARRARPRSREKRRRARTGRGPRNRIHRSGRGPGAGRARRGVVLPISTARRGGRPASACRGVVALRPAPTRPISSPHVHVSHACVARITAAGSARCCDDGDLPPSTCSTHARVVSCRDACTHGCHMWILVADRLNEHSCAPLVRRACRWRQRRRRRRAPARGAGCWRSRIRWTRGTTWTAGGGGALGVTAPHVSGRASGMRAFLQRATMRHASGDACAVVLAASAARQAVEKNQRGCWR
eukprot:gene21917-biopygen5700